MRYILIFILFTFNLTNSKGQNLDKIEDELISVFKKIEYGKKIDTLEKYNNIFKTKLKYYTSKYPNLISYDFNKIGKEGLEISISSDMKFRIYSWNTWMGGTQDDIDNIFQLKIDSNATSTDIKLKEGDFSGIYTQIFKVENPNRNIYIGYFYLKTSSMWRTEAVKLFEISGNKLNYNSETFKTKSGLSNRIYYNFITDTDNYKEITFDNSTNTLCMPIAFEDGKLSKKFIFYQFDGTYFRQKK